jgi:hypothetical protein
MKTCQLEMQDYKDPNYSWEINLLDFNVLTLHPQVSQETQEVTLWFPADKHGAVLLSQDEGELGLYLKAGPIPVLNRITGLPSSECCHSRTGITMKWNYVGEFSYLHSDSEQVIPRLLDSYKDDLPVGKDFLLEKAKPIGALLTNQRGYVLWGVKGQPQGWQEIYTWPIPGKTFMVAKQSFDIDGEVLNVKTLIVDDEDIPFTSPKNIKEIENFRKRNYESPAMVME